jgi:hypothetical protein
VQTELCPQCGQRHPPRPCPDPDEPRFRTVEPVRVYTARTVNTQSKEMRP